MDKILSINTIKNVFSALGAKTSDSNYGVALLDKTSGEPKGLMGMSDLASVLGAMPYRGPVTSDGEIDAILMTQNGTYTLSGYTGTHLSQGSFGIIDVICGNGYARMNIITTTTGNDFVVYSRMSWGNNWSSWIKLS